jgi:hypothetical protein
MHSENRKSLVWPLLVMAALFAFLLLVSFDPGPYLVVEKGFDFGHLLLFGAVSLVLLAILKRGGDRSARPYGKAFLLTVGLGLATEIVQVFIPARSFELGDLLYDSLGALGFLSVRYVARERGVAKGVRMAVLAGCSIGVAVAFLPVVQAAIDALYMQTGFPRLASFERNTGVEGWRANHGILSRTQEQATHGAHSMKVVLEPGRYAGFGTRHMIRDWRGYETLALDIVLPGTEPLTLTLAIHDAHYDASRGPPFQQKFSLHPGLNTLRISLKEIQNAPKARKTDMRAVSVFRLYTENLAEKRTLYLDNVRLTGGLRPLSFIRTPFA